MSDTYGAKIAVTDEVWAQEKQYIRWEVRKCAVQALRHSVPTGRVIFRLRHSRHTYTLTLFALTGDRAVEYGLRLRAARKAGEPEPGL